MFQIKLSEWILKEKCQKEHKDKIFGAGEFMINSDVVAEPIWLLIPSQQVHELLILTQI